MIKWTDSDAAELRRQAHGGVDLEIIERALAAITQLRESGHILVASETRHFDYARRCQSELEDANARVTELEQGIRLALNMQSDSNVRWFLNELVL